MRQVGEGRVALHIAAAVQHTPGEHRHHIAGACQRHHLRQEGRAGLVVDGDLAAHQAEPCLAAPAHAEHEAHIEAEQEEGQHWHEVERGGALAAIDQLAIAQPPHLGRAVDAERLRQIDGAAGRRDHEGDQLRKFITHPWIAQQVGELRRARGADEGQAIRPRALRELVGAGDGAAAGHVAHDDVRLPRQVFADIGRHEARPHIAAAGFREGNHELDRAAGEILRASGAGQGCCGGGGAKQQGAAPDGGG
jgi:hypothetical protein